MLDEAYEIREVLEYHNAKSQIEIFDRLITERDKLKDEARRLQNQKNNLREAVKKFFTLRGSACVSAMCKLLNLAGVDLATCANGDLISDLRAENERLRSCDRKPSCECGECGGCKIDTREENRCICAAPNT